MKIGILLLFMIGLFTVQLDWKSTLIENDVGIETIDISITKNFPAIAIMQNLEMQVQVMAPLKYPLVELQSNLIKVKKDVVYSGAISNDYTVNRQLVNKINNEKVCFTNASDQSIITGLFRLDIGESFIQKT